MLLVVCQITCDVTLGCEDCKTLLVLFDRSLVSQMSVGLLLVKSVSLPIVCLSSVDVANTLFVRSR